MNSRTIGLIQVVLASVTFGFIGIFSKCAFAAGVTVGELVTMRFVFATAILGAFLLLYRPRVFRLGLKQTSLSLVLGMVGYAVFATLYIVAIQGLSVALAVLLLYTFPFWTFLINVILGERPSAAGFAGLSGALAGLVLLLWGELRVESAWAVACGVGSAVSYAIYVVVSGRLQKGVPPLGSGFWIIAGSAFALAAFHRPDLRHLADMGSAQFVPMFLLALVSTVFPLVLIQAGLQHLSSTETAILSMVEPVTASIAAAFLLGEHPKAIHIMGGILVLGSLLLVSLKGSARRSPSP